MPVVCLAMASALTACGDSDKGSADAGVEGGSDAGTGGAGGSAAGAGGTAGAGTGGIAGGAGGDATDAGGMDASDPLPANITLTVVSAGGPSPDRQAALLSNLDDVRTSDDNGQIVFEDVPHTYGVIALTYGTPMIDGEGNLLPSEVRTVEYQALTRRDPGLALSTGFARAGNTRLSGEIVGGNPGALIQPAESRAMYALSSFEGESMLAVCAQDVGGCDAGTFVSRGMLWQDYAPFELRLAGFWYWQQNDARPVYVASGVHAPLTLNYQVEEHTDLSIDYDTALPARDYDITLGWGSLDESAEVDIALWSMQLGGERLPVRSVSTFAGVLHHLPRSDAGPVQVPSRVPEAGAAVLAQFGDEDSAVRIVQPALNASGTFQVEAGRLPGSLAPAAMPADIQTNAPVLSWDAVPGAAAIIVSIYQDASTHYAVLPGDATQLDLSARYALAGPFASNVAVQWDVTAVYLEGFSPDVDADGTGRVLFGGLSRLRDYDTVSTYHRFRSWTALL